MSKQLRNIVLLPNTSKTIDLSLVRNLALRMCAHGATVRADEQCREYLADAANCVSFAKDDALFYGADVIFVLGGDGSVIEAARRTTGMGIPIVAVNCGRLGYLAEIEIGELSLVDQILDGNYTVEERMMLHVQVIRNGSVIGFDTPALNDAVLSNGPITRLLSFELFCNGELVETCYADGMILSTSTGSTAYSRSAGGPILDPSLDCICVTPICPQTMNTYPVIFGGGCVLELKNMKSRGNQIYLSMDGREYLTVLEDDTVRISRSDCRTPLIRVKNGGFLSVLRQKLS